jgi:putative transposase
MAMGGPAYHVLNRAVRRDHMFDKDADFAAFERVLVEAWERTATRLLAYCVMPNDWHPVLWPRTHGALSAFVR